MATKYVAIHAHFYQPSRVDPFTGEDYYEPEASPFRNFNELITAQCYRPNAELGNFASISFDVGPTLTDWLALRHPDLLDKIAEADRSGLARFGYGGALAMPYSHPILPLLSDFDKQLQIRWGIADFRLRFGRSPEGMWLPETAVDVSTLEAVAEAGIRFTLVAAWQLETWPESVNLPRLVRLPSGRTMSCFVFDPQLSQHVSFNPSATESASAFASLALPMRVDWRLERTGDDQLLLIASDGELYGHHQKFRDLFLADLVQNRLADNGFTLSTLPALFRLMPAREEAKIRELSSWSCIHNLGRWQGGCPCSPGNGWKAAFSGALRWLWDQMLELFDAEASTHLDRPRELLLNYIDCKVGLRSFEDAAQAVARGRPSVDTLKALEQLCDAMYYRTLSQGSDPLFFDELSRPEPRYTLVSAKKALALIGPLAGDLEKGFLARLQLAVSTKSGVSAADIYAQLSEHG